MIFLILLIITAYLINLILPWWGIAITGLILGFQMKPSSGKAFGIGFLALFLLWGGQAFYIHVANDGVLSTRIAEMLGVGSPILVVLITGVIGGVVSGLAVLSGGLLPLNGKG
ncbi:MAG: hypothetical protein ABJR05_08930 [Balneola sp.]